MKRGDLTGEGLLDGGPVVCLRTGGQPALFARDYGGEIVRRTG